MKKHSKRPCKGCGKLFDGRNGHQKYCSDACALKAKRKQKEESRKRRVEQMRADGTLVKVCEVCGKKFESIRSDRRFCSPECGEKGETQRPGKTVCRGAVRRVREDVQAKNPESALLLEGLLEAQAGRGGKGKPAAQKG